MVSQGTKILEVPDSRSTTKIRIKILLKSTAGQSVKRYPNVTTILSRITLLASPHALVRNRGPLRSFKKPEEKSAIEAS